MLQEKTALITGASRGIGKAIASTFARHGAFVGLNYVAEKEMAHHLLTQIKKRGGNGMLLPGDVSKDASTILETFLQKTGRIEILVNNAGIYTRGHFTTLTPLDWQRVLDVNLTGCYHMSKQCLPHMKPGGRIIFISSQLAFKGSTHGAGYAASKAGMIGLMKSLALETADKKITVNAVAPGTIDTDIIGFYTKNMREKRIGEIPLGRLGTPQDVANVCLFLASELSGYITGETIHVNGGLYIH
jgi:3-oxoacyl-[acyl-carrier protein] reductase